MLARHGNWTQVQAGNHTGWVRTSHLFRPPTRFSSPLRNASITSPFGYRSIRTPFGGQGRHFHRGVDLIVRRNNRAPILAAASGTVVAVRYDARGYGHYVTLRHNMNGRTYYTLYAHLRQRSNVRVGQRVRRGQRIGIKGSTGNSTGPHLHFEIHIRRFTYSNATAINPMRRMRLR